MKGKVHSAWFVCCCANKPNVPCRHYKNSIRTRAPTHKCIHTSKFDVIKVSLMFVFFRFTLPLNNKKANKSKCNSNTLAYNQINTFPPLTSWLRKYYNTFFCVEKVANGCFFCCRKHDSLFMFYHLHWKLHCPLVSI